ncbi:hypothetical protein DFJ73DRAFT_233658 [Zopfochytrium polystomum]|nr:hypothetical protein DFJ73DRAFT_233658 [Zopfochytrium polystomum]
MRLLKRPSTTTKYLCRRWTGGGQGLIAACTVLSSESVLEAFRLAGAPMSKSECESLYSQAGISGNAVERIDIIRKACDLVGQDLVIEQVLPLFDHNATQTIATTTTETTSTTTAVPMESSSTNTKETDAINYDLTEAELASSIVVTLTKTTVNPVTNEVIESVDYDLSLPEAFLSGSWQRIIRIVTTRYTTFNTAVFLTCIGESSGSLTESSLLDAFSKAGAPLSPGELDLCKGEVSKENSYALMKLMTIVRKAVQLVGVDLVVEQVLPLLDYRVSSSTEVSNSATMVNTSPTPDSVYQTAVPKTPWRARLALSRATRPLQRRP